MLSAQSRKLPDTHLTKNDRVLMSANAMRAVLIDRYGREKLQHRSKEMSLKKERPMSFASSQWEIRAMA